MTDYATLAEFKAYLRMPADATAEDSLMEMAITSASRAIDQATGRSFSAEPALVETRYYEVVREGVDYFIDIDDVFDTTGLQVLGTSDGITWDIEFDYTPLPWNATANGKPITRLHVGATGFSPFEVVRVDALWGWEAIPATIKNATLIQAHRFWKRRDAPFGVAGSPEMGNELRLLAKVDPDVELMVKPYKKIWAAV